MSELLGPDAALRRALRAAAEQVDPGDDGLDRIRARVHHRRPMPLPTAWVDVALTKLSLRVPDGFWVVWDRVAHEVRTVTDQFLPERLRSERLRFGWLRPVAAMGAAVFLVAVVVSMAIEVPQVISPAGSTTNQPGQGSQQQTGGNGGPGGQPQTTQGSNSPGRPAPSVSGVNPSACTSKSPRPMITSSPAPSSSSPTQSASPTPSATSPSTSASPTPTPSDSQSSAPSGSGIGQPGAGGTGLTVGSATAANAANSGAAAASNSTLGTTRARSRASASPCPSATPSRSSTVKPQAVSAVPWSLRVALSPAELRARN